ncbi:conserved hypothetical protein [Ricinus communis]|uniref:Uncharacterized protein n=1 Tax=Ricinus communis TaxID=3988 RepID=B9RAB1_RICCO|nr:conserved hypothetical protein [Ricinus communis]
MVKDDLYNDVPSLFWRSILLEVMTALAAYMRRIRPKKEELIVLVLPFVVWLEGAAAVCLCEQQEKARRRKETEGETFGGSNAKMCLEVYCT